MTELLAKLNYKGQERIAVINAGEGLLRSLSETLSSVIIDTAIDPRYPYSFSIIFVKTTAEVERMAPIAVHNLVADGVLWFCYPRKTTKSSHSGLDRDHGWKVLNDSGFQGVRMVSVDDTWSAMRFRNSKFIRSATTRKP